jgi:hypothetical protein
VIFVTKNRLKKSTKEKTSMKLQTIPFHDFVVGSGIYAPSFFESYLDAGLLFFSGTGVVLIVLSLAEKVGWNINTKAVMFAIQLITWVGLGIFLIWKNPIWKWI